MGQTHYPQIIRDEAVLFYERGHTFAETHTKYGMSESTFYAWKKKFDLAHPLSDPAEKNENIKKETPTSFRKAGNGTGGNSTMSVRH